MKLTTEEMQELKETLDLGGETTSQGYEIGVYMNEELDTIETVIFNHDAILSFDTEALNQIEAAGADVKDLPIGSHRTCILESKADNTITLTDTIEREIKFILTIEDLAKLKSLC